MRHIAERLLRAICLAETISFAEWQKGSVDREQIRELKKNILDEQLTKNLKLDKQFEVLSRWVEKLITGDLCAECAAVLMDRVEYNGIHYCSEGCRDEAKDAGYHEPRH